MLCRCRNRLAKPLLLSSMAAARVGPKTRKPRRCMASTMPRERGSSGPTIVRSGCSMSATWTMASRSLRSTGTQRAIWAMPPLPGAHTISVTRLLRLTAQANACSRPPEPRIKTFIGAFLLFLVAPDAERLSEQTEVRKSTRAEVFGHCQSPILPVPYTEAWGAVRADAGQVEGRAMGATRIKPYLDQVDVKEAPGRSLWALPVPYIASPLY